MIVLAPIYIGAICAVADTDIPGRSHRAAFSSQEECNLHEFIDFYRYKEFPTLE